MCVRYLCLCVCFCKYLKWGKNTTNTWKMSISDVKRSYLFNDALNITKFLAHRVSQVYTYRIGWMLPISGQFGLSTMRFHLIYAGVAFCGYHECVNGLNSNCVEENSNYLPFVCHSCVWKWLFDVYICSSARIIFFLLFYIFLCEFHFKFTKNTYLIPMIPENVSRRFGPKSNSACQVYRAAFVHE